MLFLLAFLIGSCGLAMLVLGSFQFRGRLVSTRTARQVGGVLAGLLPVYILIRICMHWVDRESGDYAAIVFCATMAMDLGLASYLFFKSDGNSRGSPIVRTPTEAVSSFADESNLPDPPFPVASAQVGSASLAVFEPNPVLVTPAAAPKPERRQKRPNVPEKDPFDFS